MTKFYRHVGDWFTFNIKLKYVGGEIPLIRKWNLLLKKYVLCFGLVIILMLCGKIKYTIR